MRDIIAHRIAGFLLALEGIGLLILVGFEPIEAWRDLDVDELRAKQHLLNIDWSMRNHEHA